MRRFDLATWENEAKKSPHFASYEAVFWGDFVLRTHRCAAERAHYRCPYRLTQCTFTAAAPAGTAASAPARS